MSSEQVKAAAVRSRTARAAKSVFRIARNVFAILGVLFAYLMYTGYQQYMDRVAAGDTSCSFTHCA